MHWSFDDEKKIKVCAKRCKQNPIITPDMGHGIGSNINGPSLIKTPDWLPNPLGNYYLYFSHHRGTYIRMAYADNLEGPWTIYEHGILHLEETICRDHIASPDMHVDDEKREIRMYFHGQVTPGRWSRLRQPSFVATSREGIHFKALPEMLGDSYFRVFRWGGYYYAIARLGILFRSVDGLTNFESGKNPFQTGDSTPNVRHLALKLEGNTLFIFYTRIGDCPEKILLTKIDLQPTGRNGRPSANRLSSSQKWSTRALTCPWPPLKSARSWSESGNCVTHAFTKNDRNHSCYILWLVRVA